MKIKDHIYEYPELVIGGNLEAVIYSYLNNVPLIYAKLNSPFEFDFFDAKLDLSIFNIENSTSTFVTNQGEEIFGLKKRFLFQRLLFVLSFSGLCPMADKVTSINIEDSIVKLITSNNRKINLLCEKIKIFDDISINGLPVHSEVDKNYKVVDWINVRSGTIHKYDLLESDSDFVNKVYFYLSERIDGNHNKKDAVCVSFMSENNLKDIDYSDIYVRFKALDMMKIAGIKGRKNGRHPKDPNRIVYRSLKIETAERKIYPAYKNFYNDFANVSFDYRTSEEIIKENQMVDGSYAEKINKFLFL